MHGMYSKTRIFNPLAEADVLWMRITTFERHLFQ